MFAKKSSARARELASDGALASGWLMKRGERNSAFKRRFSVLRHTATFAYFKGDTESVPLGAVDASNYVAVSSDVSGAGKGGGFPFTLEPVDGSGETRVFTLEAPSAEARQAWLAAFQKANVNVEAEMARVRKELLSTHSANVSRVEQEFEAARSAMRAEVAALESALAGERAHAQELEKVVAVQRKALLAADARLAELYNEVEEQSTGAVVRAEPLAVAGDNRPTPEELSAHVLDTISKLKGSQAISYAMFRVERRRKSEAVAPHGVPRQRSRRSSSMRHRDASSTSLGLGREASGLAVATVPEESGTGDSDDGDDGAGAQVAPAPAAATNGSGPGSGGGGGGSASDVAPVGASDAPGGGGVAGANGTAVGTDGGAAARAPTGTRNGHSSAGAGADVGAGAGAGAGVAAGAGAGVGTPAGGGGTAVGAGAGSGPATPARHKAGDGAGSGGGATPASAGSTAIAADSPAPPVSASAARPAVMSAGPSFMARQRQGRRRQRGGGRRRDGWDSSDTEAYGSFALDLQRRRSSSVASSQVTAGPPKSDLQRLQEFYSIYEPSKVKDAPSILKAFEGREAALWRLVEEKYKRSVHQATVLRPLQFSGTAGASRVSTRSVASGGVSVGNGGALDGGLPDGEDGDDGVSGAASVPSHASDVNNDTPNAGAGADADLASELARSLPPQWIDDKTVRACQICMEKFSFARRRHHCRRCGRCVCATCAPSELSKCIPEFGYFKPVRHCRDCYGL